MLTRNPSILSFGVKARSWLIAFLRLQVMKKSRLSGVGTLGIISRSKELRDEKDYGGMAFEKA